MKVRLSVDKKVMKDITLDLHLDISLPAAKRLAKLCENDEGGLRDIGAKIGEVLSSYDQLFESGIERDVVVANVADPITQADPKGPKREQPLVG